MNVVTIDLRSCTQTIVCKSVWKLHIWFDVLLRDPRDSSKMDIPARHATPLAKCKCGNNAAVTAAKISAMRMAILGVKLCSIDMRRYKDLSPREKIQNHLEIFSYDLSVDSREEIFSMSISSLQFSIDRFRHRMRTCFFSSLISSVFSCKIDQKRRKEEENYQNEFFSYRYV